VTVELRILTTGDADAATLQVQSVLFCEIRHHQTVVGGYESSRRGLVAEREVG
jgi:hypothetical protein